MLKRISAQLGHRYRQLHWIWAQGGSQRLLDRVTQAAADRLTPTTLPLPVLVADVLKADLTTSRKWPSLPVESGHPLVVNWVTTPPSAGSGGHTTMFRLIEHLERAGHRCRVYLYDVHGGDASYYIPQVRSIFPRFVGEIGDVSAGMADAHAVIATSWQTAYPVYNDDCRGKRFYLVQDYEPWFFPVGGRSALAENTYRMGFHAVTAGRFLAEKVNSDFGMAADAFEFGCDTEKYHLLHGAAGKRDGIVFYVRPAAPRRAFELGIMALHLFSQRHPGIKIHFYGQRIGKLPFLSFPFIDHGLLTPAELNQIYNSCFAGLTLSMTNVSLVPHEMLAAGCIPVVNEARHNRIVLDNAFVRYAPPTPHALAAALSEVVLEKDFGALAGAASTSVASASWEAAGVAVEQSLQRAIRNV